MMIETRRGRGREPMTDDQAPTASSESDATRVDVPVATPGEPATPAPVPASAPAPGPVGQPAEASPAAKPRRTMGRAGQTVGVIGLIVSVVLAIATLGGTVWLTGQINDVSAQADARLAEGGPVLDTLSVKIGDIKSVVDEVVAAADAVAGTAAPSEGIVATLRDKLDSLAARYAELRQSYTNLREQVLGAVRTLELLGRVVPGFSIPQGPLDALTTLDSKIQELDSTISGVLGTDFATAAQQQTAAVVSEKVGKISAALDGLLGVISNVQAKLDSARADIAAAVSQLVTVITVGGIVLALIFLYMAFLHWVLLRTSRAVGRGG
jgi:hypothetical protein